MSTLPLCNLCVFCGASSGKAPSYLEAARALGQQLIKEQIGLVYGGGTVGLMGEIARTVAQGAGAKSVIGVIPEALTAREVSGEMIGQAIVVKDMHERKALMAKHADGFIALPGGFGTLEELLEVITWQQLGFHQKPIGLLNIDGFYDPLLAFFNKCVEEGFIKPQYNNVLVSSDPAELILQMRHFVPAVSLVQERMSAQAQGQALGMIVSGQSTEANR